MNSEVILIYYICQTSQFYRLNYLNSFMQHPKNIAIVGSGLVGSLLGIYLKKKGHEVTIYDRRPDIRKIKFSDRKSVV